MTAPKSKPAITNEMALTVNKILNKFQVRLVLNDVPSLTFEKLYNFLNHKEARTLEEICDLSRQEALSLDVSVPKKLIKPYKFWPYGQRFVRLSPEVAQAFRLLNTAYRQQTTQNLTVISGYRSPAYQSMLVLRNLVDNNLDLKECLRVIKLPGTSQHNQSVNHAVDFGNTRSEFMTTQDASYLWLKAHAGQYGFINPYDGQRDIDVINEPWHWLYIGW